MGEDLRDAGKTADSQWSWPGWRGRSREWRAVVDLLRATRAGRGGMVLVEGRQGLGKSQLLHEAREAAEQAGITVAHGVADELGQLTPVAPLVAALGEPAPELPGEHPASEDVDLRLLLVERLRALLEERVAQGPLLITLDDLHWADPTTQLALRSLLPELTSYPLAWILARTSGFGDPGLDRLYDQLEQDGATRVVLRPLDERAVAEVVTDFFGAEPGRDVLELAAGADGNPFLLTELLRTCKLEGVVEIDEGSIRLTSTARIQASTRSRLIGLSEQTRHLLQVAGVLGRSFSVDDLAEMIGEPVDALLPGLAEAVRAGVVVPAVDRLAFRHDLLWQAVTEGLSDPVRTALNRQVGEMLLRRGAVIPAAAYLMRCAGPGDTRALDGLDRAAREVLPYAPRTAVDLAVRALELTEPDDPAHCIRAATAVECLTAAGRLAEAMEFARDALRQAPPGPQAARMQYELVSVLQLSGRPADAVAEAEDLLTRADLPDEQRGAAELAIFQGLMALHDFGRGRKRAKAILADPERHGDAAVVGAHMLAAHLAWEEAKAEVAFRHMREAVGIADGGCIEARRAHPSLYLARCRVGMGQTADAEAAIQAAAADIEAIGPSGHAPSPAFFRACMWLGSGRLDDAAAEAEAGLKAAEDLGAHTFALLGLAVLAIVELRRGDVETAARHIEGFQSEQRAAHSAMFGSEWGAWAVAQVGEAQGGPERAMELLDRSYVDRRSRRWMLMLEPNAAAWMTRTALEAGHRSAAEDIVDTARRIAHDNPGFPTLAAAAAHAHGILRRDGTLLEQAIDQYLDPWGRASAAEDLGVLLTEGTDAKGAARKDAIGRLDEAADGYQRIGALRDAARARARLRNLGVRRRHWTYADRPTSGWESLTDTERNVATLVAQGLTNRQVATQMFLSPHTVSFHLRQVFRKLGIGSRVELARIAVEQPNETASPDDD